MYPVGGIAISTIADDSKYSSIAIIADSIDSSRPRWVGRDQELSILSMLPSMRLDPTGLITDSYIDSNRCFMNYIGDN